MSITSSTISKKTYKIILLGDSSTGKTSIIERFVNNKFEEKDNVSFPLFSRPLESISLAKTSLTTTKLVDCNYGIPQASRDTKV